MSQEGKGLGMHAMILMLQGLEPDLLRVLCLQLMQPEVVPRRH